MSKLYNQLAKIDFISTNAVRVLNTYKSIKLKFIDFEFQKALNPSFTKKEIIEYNKSRKFTTDKNICFAPKKSMIFSFDGSVYVCCENKQYAIGNINTETIHDIWFGEKRKFIDTKINRDYNLEYGCSSCKLKIKNRDYGLALAQTFDIHTNNHSVYPARLDFEIHNTCNLECVMCGGIYSSSIQSNRNKLPSIPMVYKDTFADQLTEFIPHVKYINLIGGEPTLIKIYYDIMEKVIELNPSCIIHLQTNASTLNNKFKNILERGNFQIGISIDSLTKVSAEKIRKNLEFEKFMDNINYYLNIYHENKIKITINTCPMPQNWQEIIPIIKFCNQHKLPVFFCIVNAPYYSTFISTSIAFIDKVHNSLTKELNNLPQNNYFEKNNYNKLKDFISMLLSWKPVILENAKNTEKLMLKNIGELYLDYENILDNNLIHTNKEKIIQEIISVVKEKLSTLEAATAKTLLIVLINSVKGKIAPSSEAEQIKWAKEFVNTLIFSYQEKETFI
jgi:radical SAM protein with 4Fe4S-binding SPASM domain